MIETMSYAHFNFMLMVVEFMGKFLKKCSFKFSCRFDNSGAVITNNIVVDVIGNQEAFSQTADVWGVG